MKKKLLSLFMACAMILALAVPAFAADEYNVHEEGNVSDELTQQVTIATRTFVPTVKLTLPTMTEPSVVLNPYKITYNSTDVELKLNGQDVNNSADQTKQVISPVYSIKNETDVKLNFTVAVTGTVEGGVTFSNDPVSVTEKNKKAHVALVVANKGVTTAPNQDNTTEQNLLTATGLSKTDVEELWLKTSEVKSSVAKTLDDAGTTANYLAFQFKGDATRQPTPNSWTADDKVGAVITFTFTPESAQDFKSPSTGAIDIGAVTCDTGAFTAFEINSTNFTDLASWHVNSDVTKANWAVYKADSKEIIQVAKNTGGTAWEIKVDANKTKLITTQPDGTTALATTASSTKYQDKVILSFVDEDNMPRTVELAIEYAVLKSA